MHDVPYIQPKDMGPEIVAHMTRICSEVRRILPSKVHCGVQVCNEGELFITIFIRVRLI